MEPKSTKWLVPQPLAFRVPSELSAEDAVSWLTAELLAHGFRIGIYEVTRAQH